jgi:ribose 5-phosphate isomerase B
MKIALSSDHAGFRYKQKIGELLDALGHDVYDLGAHNEEPVNYPLFIWPVAEGVATGKYERGIVLGGSGNGEAMAANRIIGVRCALCWNVESARLARRHNDANMISIGQRMMTLNTARAIVRAWLDTPFEGGRHDYRVRLLDSYFMQTVHYEKENVMAH